MGARGLGTHGCITRGSVERRGFLSGANARTLDLSSVKGLAKKQPQKPGILDAGPKPSKLIEVPE